MINLLPIEDQINIRRTYRLRSIIVLCWLILGLVLISTVMLVPAYIVQTKRAEGAKALLESSLKTAKESGKQEGLAKLAATETKVKLLVSATSTPRVAQFIPPISSLLTSGIRVTKINFLDTGTIELAGSAATRENMRDFILALEREEKFSEVLSPISNLVRETEIPFTISLLLKKS
jgi:Tfp pilus assembly protein PilN